MGLRPICYGIFRIGSPGFPDRPHGRVSHRRTWSASLSTFNFLSPVLAFRMFTLRPQSRIASSPRNAARLGGDQLESRKSTRFHLEVPVVCRWQHNDSPEEFDGVTHDISTGGIFVHSAECPPVGTAISFEATLPPLQSTAAPLRMEGYGRVLRVHQEEDPARCGFAASAGFTLRDSEDEFVDITDGR